MKLNYFFPCTLYICSIVLKPMSIKFINISHAHVSHITDISGIYFAVFLQADILIVPVDGVSGTPMLAEEFHSTIFTIPALTVLLPKWFNNKLVALETLNDFLNSNFQAGIIRDSVAYKLLAGDVNS